MIVQLHSVSGDIARYVKNVFRTDVIAHYNELK